MKCAIVSSKDVFDQKKNPTMCISAKRYTSNCVNCNVFQRAFYKWVKVKKTPEELARSSLSDTHKSVKVRLRVDKALKRLKCKPFITKKQMEMLYERDKMFDEYDKLQKKLDEMRIALALPDENEEILDEDDILEEIENEKIHFLGDSEYRD